MLEVFSFVIGIFLGMWWFSVIILPIIYGLPRSLYYIGKGVLRGSAVLVYLTSPIIWTIIFTVAALVVVAYLPRVHHFLIDSYGFIIGQWLGVIVSLGRMLSRYGRTDLQKDFWTAMEHYKKVMASSD